MTYPTVQRLLLAAACLLIVLTGHAQGVMRIQGEIKGKNNVPVSLLRDPYGAATELAKDTIRNGRFTFRVPVDEITPVAVVYSENRMRNTYTVILEEGDLQFALTPTNMPQLKGGKYNDWLFAYQHDPAFLRADAAFTKTKAELAIQPDSIKEWQSVQDFLLRNDIRSKHLEKIMHNGKDPLAAVMAAVLLDLQPDPRAAMAIVEAATGKLGEKSYNILAARRMEESIRKQFAVRKGIMTGQPFTDFTAATVKGDSLRMSAIVREHPYTLLQFWASWCVPCRAELPQLRGLYESYKNKGLAIVSFSMDSNPVAWKKASEQEKIGWPNVSDLLAQKSPVIRKYPVNGVPANVIIDRNGTIVASNIFGEELEEKIKSLFP